MYRFSFWGVFKVFCISLALGVGYVAGFDCNATQVTHCYNDLVYFEGLGFPLYGYNEESLDETCKSMNFSFECIEVYADLCHGNPLCDKDCIEIVNDITAFSKNTRLREFQDELCTPHMPIRETYLENYSCLEENADSYGTCHNDSQISQDFMSHIVDPKEVVAARCCFFSWYHDCFTNITRDSCGDNATFFVSFSLHKLVGHISEHLCGDEQVFCDRPPLPGAYVYGNDPLDKDDPDLTITDVDNSITEKSDTSAGTQWFSSRFVMFACCLIFMSKYML